MISVIDDQRGQEMISVPDTKPANYARIKSSVKLTPGMHDLEPCRESRLAEMKA
jgi:hypothetical protein